MACAPAAGILRPLRAAQSRLAECFTLSRTRENTIGVLSLLAVALCWGLVASTVKRLTVLLDAHTISFFRVSLATIVFVVLFGEPEGQSV